MGFTEYDNEGEARVMAKFDIAAIFKLLGMAVQAAKNPLVVKFMDNVVKGTPNRIDDMVWAVFKTLMGTNVATVQAKLNDKLASVQAKYDAMSPEKRAKLKAEAAKTFNPLDPFGDGSELGTG